jgi:hypothetical protein
MTAPDPDIYSDAFDSEIDTDPYPVWRRIRNGRPVYYNERSDFCVLSRSTDVERGLERKVALYEVLPRFPSWEVDWDQAKQARTSTVRGWERLPVITSP